mgnify:CR=1 FL=1
MKLISKNNEPTEWTQFRNTPGTDYESSPVLRQALYKEQGGICAYCMKRLYDEFSGGVSSNKIEHIKARSQCTRDERMQYKNMILCCSGIENSNSPSATHCDTHRGNEDIGISPLNPACIESISYSRNGQITSSNPEWNRDINDTLNLNHPILVANRKSAISGIIRFLGEKEVWKQSEIKALIKSYESKDNNGLYKEYAAALAYKLNKWLAVKMAQ